MGTMMIDGVCVDLMTYAKAMRQAREEAGGEPEPKEVKRLVFNRIQMIHNIIACRHIAEGAD